MHPPLHLNSVYDILSAPGEESAHLPVLCLGHPSDIDLVSWQIAFLPLGGKGPQKVGLPGAPGGRSVSFGARSRLPINAFVAMASVHSLPVKAFFLAQVSRQMIWRNRALESRC